MLALGSCHPACKREAMYLRSLEVEIAIGVVILIMLSSCYALSYHQRLVLIENTQGFVAAAGQVVLSLIVLSRGVLIHR